MESLDGIVHMMLNGVRATLVLDAGATLAEADVQAALAAEGLKFASLERQVIDYPAAAYVAVTPGSL